MRELFFILELWTIELVWLIIFKGVTICKYVNNYPLLFLFVFQFCIYFFVLLRILGVGSFNKILKFFLLIFSQECCFRYQLIVDQRQLNSMQWWRHYGKLHWCLGELNQLLIMVLSEYFHPDIDPMEILAHVYVQSVHNIAIEHSWLHLCLEFGDNAVICFKQGEDDGLYMYLAHICQRTLCRYLHTLTHSVLLLI